MSQRQKPVIRVLAVESVIGPVAVETAAAGPKRIDEIKTALLDGFDGGLHARKRVQSCRGRKQVRDRRSRRRVEAAILMAAGEQPGSQIGGTRFAEVPRERTSSGRRRSQSH